jgi:hypothetical protein
VADLQQIRGFDPKRSTPGAKFMGKIFEKKFPDATLQP